MAKQFWEVVNRVIEKSDIVLEVLDARFPDKTRNREIEDKARKFGKKIIYVVNKCDLVEKGEVEKLKRKLRPSVFVSATKHQGTMILLRTISRMAKDKVVVGVVGYPNTGKSSVINALKGRASASSSPQSGHTKGEQLVKVTRKIYLMDTPGVLPYMEKDEVKHALIGSVDFSKVKDVEDTALRIIESNIKRIKKHFGIKADDPEEVLEEIALKLNKLKKGGVPDTKAAARSLLQDIQRGRIILKELP